MDLTFYPGISAEILSYLYTCAQRFNFDVDNRGPWPVMTQGQRAMICRSRRDVLAFISVTSRELAAKLNETLGTY